MSPVLQYRRKWALEDRGNLKKSLFRSTYLVVCFFMKRKLLLAARSVVKDNRDQANNHQFLMCRSMFF